MSGPSFNPLTTGVAQLLDLAVINGRIPHLLNSPFRTNVSIRVDKIVLYLVSDPKTLHYSNLEWVTGTFGHKLPYLCY